MTMNKTVFRPQSRTGRLLWGRQLRIVLTGFIASFGFTAETEAQSVMIVGTQHLTGLETRPTLAQYDHTVETLSQYRPTQVCVERMDGERVEALIADPERNAMSLSPDTHGRPVGTRFVPLGVELQTILAIRPADARDEAKALAARWDEIDLSDRIRLIGLQIAGYEIYSAVLNWSYLSANERGSDATEILGSAVATLNDLLDSEHEVYALAIPIARRAGLHRLCMADALENESAGMKVALDKGGQAILDQAEVRLRLDQYSARMKTIWKPGSGPEALTQMLAYINSDEFAEFDRENQWEILRQFDTDSGIFHQRLMHWHARTAQISAELYEALAEGPEERVMLIIGAAHRPFNEAEMRVQPWFRIEPARNYLGPHTRER